MISRLLLLMPSWAWAALLMALLAVAFGFGVGIGGDRVEARFADARGKWAGERQAAAQAQQRVEREYRETEQALIAGHKEKDDAAQNKLAALAVDLDRSRGAADGLRRARDAAVAAARAQTASCAAPQPIGPTAADPVGMLADVLGRADERAGVLAAFADRTRIAHEACVSEYGAVKAALAAAGGP